MVATTITQPIAVKDDLTVAAEPRADAPSHEPLSAAPVATAAARATPVQIVMVLLGLIAFLYFARPAVLPVVLACIAGMTLKPVIRWLSLGHIPPALSAPLVLSFLAATIGIGFFQLGRPALARSE